MWVKRVVKMYSQDEWGREREANNMCSFTIKLSVSY